ncbi:MAG: hypothetical protein AAF654_05155 [Myxococcota bacterium]
MKPEPMTATRSAQSGQSFGAGRSVQHAVPSRWHVNNQNYVTKGFSDLDYGPGSAAWVGAAGLGLETLGGLYRFYQGKRTARAAKESRDLAAGVEAATEFAFGSAMVQRFSQWAATTLGNEGLANSIGQFLAPAMPAGFGLLFASKSLRLAQSLERPGITESADHLGWMLTSAGWFSGSISAYSGAAAALSTPLTASGLGLLTATQSKELVRSVVEKNSDRLVQSTGMLAMNTGIAMFMMGLPLVGAGVMLFGLAPLLLQGNQAVRSRIDPALERAFDRIHTRLPKTMETLEAGFSRLDAWTERRVDPLKQRLHRGLTRLFPVLRNCAAEAS